MKQTEPIGFKGTKNEWRIIPVFMGEELKSYNIVSTEDIIAVIKPPKYHNEPREESAYDFALMAASKKMAIALQNILDDSIIREDSNGFSTILIRKERIAEAKEALKEAGLND